MFSKYTLAFYFLIITFHLPGQSNIRVDSLNRELEKSRTDNEKIELLNQLAREYLNFNIQGARKCLEQSLILSKKLNDEQNMADVYILFSDYFMLTHDLDSSIYYANEAFPVYKDLNDWEGLFDVYNFKGILHKALSNNDSAEYYFRLTLDIAKKQSHTTLLAKSYLRLGALYCDNYQNYVQAEEYTLMALDFANKNKDKGLEAMIHYNLGVIRDNVSDAAGAEKHLLMALNYFTQMNYIHKQIVVYLRLAGIFFNIDNFKKSRSYYLKLLELSIKSNYDAGKAAAYHNLASINYYTGNIDSAIVLYLKAVPINVATKNMDWLNNNYSQLALCYADKNEFAKALDFTQKSLEINIQQNDSLGIATAFVYTAQIYFKQNTVEMSLQYLAKAEEMLATKPDIELQGDLHELYAKVFAKKQDYKKAFFHFEQYIKIKDSLQAKLQKEVVEELEIRYNVEKKDMELQQNEIKIQNLQKDNKIKTITSVSAIILFALALLILFFVYKFVVLKNKRKAERLLFEKQFIEKDANIAKLELSKAEEEITHQANLILEKNKLINKIKEELDSIKEYSESNRDIELQKISELLSSRIIREEDWSEFKKRFEVVHPQFITKLNIHFGKLSASETRLACLIKLNISNKDIAAMLGISPESVLKSRYRFKKKLNLNDDEQLDHILCEL